MPTPASAYLYDVLHPILHPVPARVGDVIAVRPGHPTHPVLVFRQQSGAWVPVADGPPNYGALVLREDDGVIRSIFSSGALPLAQHPLAESA